MNEQKNLVAMKGMKFKDKGNQIGNYMFVNGGVKATKGAPIITNVPETKFIRNFSVRGTSKLNNEKEVSLEKFTDSGESKGKYIYNTQGGKSRSGITIEKGTYLSCLTISKPGRSTEHVSSYRDLKYEDITDHACYHYSHDGDIKKVDCPSDAPFYQPPGPTTDPCKMSKCPIDMPPYYYENRNSNDTSLLYKLDNWPGCNGGLAWLIKNKKANTIGEAYDIILGDKNNSPLCQSERQATDTINRINQDMNEMLKKEKAKFKF
jgi:hypothetical protein